MLVIMRMLYWLNFSHKIGKESTTGKIGQESFIKLRKFFSVGICMTDCGFLKMVINEKKIPNI